MLVLVAVLMKSVAPPGAQVPLLFFSLPGVIAISHMFVGQGNNGVPIIMTLILLPAVFLMAMTAAIRRPILTERRIHRAFESVAVMLLVTIVLKLLLYGGDGRELSSRPFGHGAALTLLVLACFASTPLSVFRTLSGQAAVVAMALSLSRTSWLMCGLGFGILLWSSYAKDIGRLLRILLLVLIAVSSLWLLLAEVPLIRQRFTGQTESSITLSSREKIWPSVLEAVPDRPMVGHGPGSSAAFVESITAGDNANPHNDFLRISYDLGVVSLVALLAGLAMVSWSQRADTVVSPLATAGSVIPSVIPVFLIFTNGLTYLGVSVPAFVVMGAAVGAAKRDKL